MKRTLATLLALSMLLGSAQAYPAQKEYTEAQYTDLLNVSSALGGVGFCAYARDESNEESKPLAPQLDPLVDKVYARLAQIYGKAEDGSQLSQYNKFAYSIMMRSRQLGVMVILREDGKDKQGKLKYAHTTTKMDSVENCKKASDFLGRLMKPGKILDVDLPSEPKV